MRPSLMEDLLIDRGHYSERRRHMAKFMKPESEFDRKDDEPVHPSAGSVLEVYYQNPGRMGENLQYASFEVPGVETSEEPRPLASDIVEELECETCGTQSKNLSDLKFVYIYLCRRGRCADC